MPTKKQVTFDHLKDELISYLQVLRTRAEQFKIPDQQKFEPAKRALFLVKSYISEAIKNLRNLDYHQKNAQAQLNTASERVVNIERGLLDVVIKVKKDQQKDQNKEYQPLEAVVTEIEKEKIRKDLLALKDAAETFKVDPQFIALKEKAEKSEQLDHISAVISELQKQTNAIIFDPNSYRSPKETFKNIRKEIENTQSSLNTLISKVKNITVTKESPYGSIDAVHRAVKKQKMDDYLKNITERIEGFKKIEGFHPSEQLDKAMQSALIKINDFSKELKGMDRFDFEKYEQKYKELNQRVHQFHSEELLKLSNKAKQEYSEHRGNHADHTKTEENKKEPGLRRSRQP